MTPHVSPKPAPRPSDQRRFPRRAKSIRFSFEQNGEEHFAVTTVVGLGGAFVKASLVPRPGTFVVLRERFNAAGVEITVRCEIVWSLDRPTIERPDIGFGFRIHEIATLGDPSHLEDFLRALDPGYKSIPGAGIAYEERSDGVHSIFRVPAIVARGEFFSDDEAGPGHHDELVELDLHAELERLARRADRDAPGQAAFNARTTVPRMPAYEDGSAEEVAPQDPDPRKRSRRRSVTGIFTAIFGRPKPSDLAQADSEARARGGEAEAGAAVREAQRPTMLLSWGATNLVARVDQLTPPMGSLWTTDIAPEPGTPVVMRPASTAAPLLGLIVHAQVVERSPRPRGGGHRIVVRITHVDEGDQPGRFEDYVRFVMGGLVGR